MVEVAVGDQDQVEFHPFDRPEIGCRQAADLLRVQAAVDDQVEIAQLDIELIGADAAIGVEINELHAKDQDREPGGRVQGFAPAGKR